jgi:hypothetical protein
MQAVPKIILGREMKQIAAQTRLINPELFLTELSPANPAPLIEQTAVRVRRNGGVPCLHRRVTMLVSPLLQ